MILTPHLLLGAVIGYKITNLPLALILALVSHYFLDLIPHIEYSISSVKNKQWKNSFTDIFKIFIDFISGIILIFIFCNLSLDQSLMQIYLCAFFAIIPDGFSLLSYFSNNKLLLWHNIFHQKRMHFLKNKTISVSWRLFSQIAIIFLSILILSN